MRVKPSAAQAIIAIAACVLLPGCTDAAAERAVKAALADSDARVQGLVDRGRYVCGEVASRQAAQRGAYVRFVFDERGESAMVDPGTTGQRPVTGSQDPVCRKPESYQTVAERMGCAAAPDLENRAERQRVFEHLWQRNCSERAGAERGGA